MLFTVKTSTDLQTIKNELEEKAKKIGFGVLKEYPFKDILQEKGFPIERDITVFEICNPPAAQKVLSSYPELSIYLPCRISLYQKDGFTIISTFEIEDMLQDFDIDDGIKNHMNEIFDKIKALLSSWN